MRKISFDQARNQYTHRYTMEHTPQWANRPARKAPTFWQKVCKFFKG